jgi:PQQ-like domain
MEVFLHGDGVTSVPGGSAVSLVTRQNARRVFVLGVAGLVPAALVTLLFIHQPAIGQRRLYPLLRGPLTAIAFTLALATVIAWARSAKRLSRQALSGLAWAAVAVLLCIGPFVESNPRDRLFALELYNDGHVDWETSGAGRHPRLIGDVLVVEEQDSDVRVCLDPAARGKELGRDDHLDAAERRCREALTEDARTTDSGDDQLEVVDGHIEAPGNEEDDPWTLDFPYAYVATPRASTARLDDPQHGTIYKIDVDEHKVVWSSALDESVASDAPSLAANADSVIVAGGESVTALEGSNGRQRWIESVVALGKSRGYALPESVHEIVIDDDNVLVLLSVTPAA